MTTPSLFIFCALSFFCFAGCSKSRHPTTHPVDGIVRFPDGQVLRDGTIEFEIIGVKNPATARATINPDGSFRLGTYDVADGAVAGKHRVVVMSYRSIGNGAERPGMIPETTLDPRFSHYRTSDLIIEVKPGTNKVMVEVDYAENTNPGANESTDEDHQSTPGT